uniref:Uncharacterized protein LOC109550613 n=1 Tax=Tursiops truncatus TaxID=9739 RepID=A0A6J3QNW2_TURTR|nr:uncharacterized protein LOC109550613 [Tursiops truncatus]
MKSKNAKNSNDANNPKNTPPANATKPLSANATKLPRQNTTNPPPRNAAKPRPAASSRGPRCSQARKRGERQGHSLPVADTSAHPHLFRMPEKGEGWQGPLGPLVSAGLPGQDHGPHPPRAGVCNPLTGLLEVAGELSQCSLLLGRPNSSCGLPSCDYLNSSYIQEFTTSQGKSFPVFWFFKDETYSQGKPAFRSPSLCSSVHHALWKHLVGCKSALQKLPSASTFLG